MLQVQINAPAILPRTFFGPFLAMVDRVKMEIRMVGALRSGFAIRASLAGPLMLVSLFAMPMAVAGSSERVDESRPARATWHTASWPLDKQRVHVAATSEFVRGHATSGPIPTVDIATMRLDDVALNTELARRSFPPAEPGDPSIVRRPRAEFRAKATSDSSVIEPDGWTAVTATLALGLFFFLRRIA